jgi:tetratricopeptide (TPR) repeat protein
MEKETSSTVVHTLVTAAKNRVVSPIVEAYEQKITPEQLQQIRKYNNQGLYSQTQELIRSIPDHEKDYSAQLQLGNSYLGLGKHDIADVHLHKALGLALRMASVAANNIAASAVLTKNYVSAIEFCTTAIDYSSDWAGPWATLFAALNMAGRRDEFAAYVDAMRRRNFDWQNDAQFNERLDVDPHMIGVRGCLERLARDTN